MKYILGALMFTLGAGASAQVAPTPGTQDVSALFEQADVVCNCSVSVVRVNASSHNTDHPIPKRSIAVLRIAQLYRSTAPSAPTLTLEYEGSQVEDGETAVMFLHAAGSSVYTLADPSIGATRFSHLTTATGDTELGRLESALLSVAKTNDHADQSNALRLLQGFGQLSPATLSQLSPLMDSPDPEVGMGAHAVLLRTGDGKYVEHLRVYLRSHPDATPRSVLSVGSELGLIRDPTALSALGELTTSKLLSVRMGSMQALRAIKSPLEAPILINRLDDPNGYIRYLAVMTLAETFGKYGDYAPNMSLFDANPDFYRGLWKSWWKTDGQALRLNQSRE